MIYEGEYTSQISFPLGGIGSGSIGLGGSGMLVDWEIFNRPAKGSLNGRTDGAHRLLNVDHYPLAHARADGSTDAHDLHNAGFGQFAHHSANFRRADVEAYNELGLVHTSPLHP